MIDLSLVIENSEVARLNAFLAKEYKTIDNHSLYRIVWSDKVYENRFGTYNDFSSGGLFIRQVTETRRTRKYPYIHERWIFEKWAPGNLTANRETPDAINGDYIPVYVFESGKGEFLPPTEKSVRFILSFMRGQIRKDDLPSQEYLDEKEIQNEVISMDTHPIFQTSPGIGRNAVGYDKGLKGK